MNTGTFIAIKHGELQSTTNTNGSVIGPVSLSTSELIGLRNARAMFDELRSLLTDAVLPAIGGAHHPVSVRLTTLLGEVHLHSAGFLAQHWREADRFAEAKEVTNVDHRNH
jgi:hypothetical protein